MCVGWKSDFFPRVVTAVAGTVEYQNSTACRQRGRTAVHCSTSVQFMIFVGCCGIIEVLLAARHSWLLPPDFRRHCPRSAEDRMRHVALCLRGHWACRRLCRRAPLFRAIEHHIRWPCRFLQSFSCPGCCSFGVRKEFQSLSPARQSALRNPPSTTAIVMSSPRKPA